ncbi:uncharacterized protein MKK02DRAFT_32876 [Dioszegia hungarica]|uniref:MARVEL domain-containing protein n=1 Tax=Dioszegia hungarica TaxID=4972 RepID=A0AA38LVL0_9TREE|nr:uncharacterized protein MKK02DRAFT_32876 [Dioszegia hungarica]KAI9635461.1 hypothetical protein MKK02DRAFT_32876 [Dioszegia hungarica]
MANIALITTILKGVTAFWSLLVLAVSAAMIAKFNSYVGGYIAGSGFSQGNAVLAAAILCFLYFSIAPASIILSVIADVAIMGFLFILNLGSVAALSDVAGAFKGCRGDRFCSLGNATLGLGWVLVFLILAILLLEIIVTLRGYGGGMSTWRTPFNELITNGTTKTGRGVEHHSEAGLGRPEGLGLMKGDGSGYHNDGIWRGSGRSDNNGKGAWSLDVAERLFMRRIKFKRRRASKYTVH